MGRRQGDREYGREKDRDKGREGGGKEDKYTSQTYTVYCVYEAL